MVKNFLSGFVIELSNIDVAAMSASEVSLNLPKAFSLTLVRNAHSLPTPWADVMCTMIASERGTKIERGRKQSIQFIGAVGVGKMLRNVLNLLDFAFVLDLEQSIPGRRLVKHQHSISILFLDKNCGGCLQEALLQINPHEEELDVRSAESDCKI